MATDRNQQARSDFEFRRATKQFQDALAAGQAGCRDRFGNLISEGDTVIFEPALSLVATVTKIVPVFDVNVPVGTMRIEMTAVIPSQIGANIPMERVLRIGKIAAGSRPAVTEPSQVPAATEDDLTSPITGEPNDEEPAAEPPVDPLDPENSHG